MLVMVLVVKVVEKKTSKRNPRHSNHHAQSNRVVWMIYDEMHSCAMKQHPWRVYMCMRDGKRERDEKKVADQKWKKESEEKKAADCGLC